MFREAMSVYFHPQALYKLVCRSFTFMALLNSKPFSTTPMNVPSVHKHTTPVQMAHVAFRMLVPEFADLLDKNSPADIAVCFCNEGRGSGPLLQQVLYHTSLLDERTASASSSPCKTVTYLIIANAVPIQKITHTCKLVRQLLVQIKECTDVNSPGVQFALFLGFHRTSYTRVVPLHKWSDLTATVIHELLHRRHPVITVIDCKSHEQTGKTIHDDPFNLAAIHKQRDWKEIISLQCLIYITFQIQSAMDECKSQWKAGTAGINLVDITRIDGTVVVTFDLNTLDCRRLHLMIPHYPRESNQYDAQYLYGNFPVMNATDALNSSTPMPATSSCVVIESKRNLQKQIAVLPSVRVAILQLFVQSNQPFITFRFNNEICVRTMENVDVYNNTLVDPLKLGASVRYKPLFQVGFLANTPLFRRPLCSTLEHNTGNETTSLSLGVHDRKHVKLTAARVKTSDNRRRKRKSCESTAQDSDNGVNNTQDRAHKKRKNKTVSDVPSNDDDINRCAAMSHQNKKNVLQSIQSEKGREYIARSRRLFFAELVQRLEHMPQYQTTIQSMHRTCDQELMTNTDLNLALFAQLSCKTFDGFMWTCIVYIQDIPPTSVRKLFDPATFSNPTEFICVNLRDLTYQHQRHYNTPSHSTRLQTTINVIDALHSYWTKHGKEPCSSLRPYGVHCIYMDCFANPTTSGIAQHPYGFHSSEFRAWKPTVHPYDMNGYDSFHNTKRSRSKQLWLCMHGVHSCRFRYAKEMAPVLKKIGCRYGDNSCTLWKAACISTPPSKPLHCIVCAADCQKGHSWSYATTCSRQCEMLYATVREKDESRRTVPANMPWICSVAGQYCRKVPTLMKQCRDKSKTETVLCCYMCWVTAPINFTTRKRFTGPLIRQKGLPFP
eukprot:3937351-Rhodomonas_salina.1